MKKILTLIILFVYIWAYAMENEKPNIMNLPLGNSLPMKHFSLILSSTRTMFETDLKLSNTKLFLCQACNGIFYKKEFAEKHGSECQYCKGSIPKCVIKAHENECKYHTIQQ